MPLWDFLQSHFEVVFKIMTIAELFIVVKTSPGQLSWINSDNVVKIIIQDLNSLTAMIAHPALKIFLCFNMTVAILAAIFLM